MQFKVQVAEFEFLENSKVLPQSVHCILGFCNQNRNTPKRTKCLDFYFLFFIFFHFFGYTSVFVLHELCDTVTNNL